MTETIVVSLISLAGTLLGSILGIIATARLTTYRIEQLEKKVDKHNNVIERVYMLEKHENNIPTNTSRHLARSPKFQNMIPN